ncbi:hypothetical protein Nepgr_014655 [Nepenthes gracilis]|uniref:DNA-directed RNA polymerases I, II, and III subunit RPABC3 n=1 Tax=Nepenthes gracilis TaxID=150966 RepID=A0AAD3SLB0_NEPGR|nr:hypothetical protein Nepgr_014655 [Nepenthes gracilis]
MAPLLFEDTFDILRLDPDGKKFDKVTRIEGQSDKFDAYMLLDVNTDIYPIHKDKRYTFGLATTLDLDGTPDTGFYNQGGRETLADRYEYVMHGRLYRISEYGSGDQVKGEIYVSCGGLLMLLRVDPNTAAKFDLDQRLFLLMKKTE